MIRCLLRVLLAAILACLLGGAATAQAAARPSSDAVNAYTYDNNPKTAVSTDTASCRGPPVYADFITSYAVDHVSRGTSARLSETVPRPTTTNAARGVPTQLVEATGATLTRAGVEASDNSSLAESDVAANAVPPRFITTGAGTTIDRLAVNTTISAQRQGRHVLSARQYGDGSYFNSADDAQGVLGAFHMGAFHSGGAQVLGTKGNDIVVRVPGITGFNHNPGAGFPNQATNVFFIKGSSSPSVVPYNPAWKP